jgi:hypothetical protein
MSMHRLMIAIACAILAVTGFAVAVATDAMAQGHLPAGAEMSAMGRLAAVAGIAVPLAVFVTWFLSEPGDRGAGGRLQMLLWAAVLVTCFCGGSAFAADASNQVVVPWGDALASLSSPVATLLFGVGLWLVRQLPAQLVAILHTQRVEQLLLRAIGYAVNSVAGAAAGKTLTVPVGNAVLAHALQYVVDRAPRWLVNWMGGPSAIAAMIWARLPMEADAERPDFSNLARFAEGLASGKTAFSVGSQSPPAKASS